MRSHTGSTLAYPRPCCLFKLSALGQTGVSSLCPRFSLCAGGWQWQRRKQQRFALLNEPVIGQGQMVLVKRYNFKPKAKLNRKEFKMNEQK